MPVGELMVRACAKVEAARERTVAASVNDETILEAGWTARRRQRLAWPGSRARVGVAHERRDEGRKRGRGGEVLRERGGREKRSGSARLQPAQRCDAARHASRLDLGFLNNQTLVAVAGQPGSNLQYMPGAGSS